MFNATFSKHAKFIELVNSSEPLSDNQAMYVHSTLSIHACTRTVLHRFTMSTARPELTGQFLLRVLGKKVCE